MKALHLFLTIFSVAGASDRWSDTSGDEAFALRLALEEMGFIPPLNYHHILLKIQIQTNQ